MMVEAPGLFSTITDAPKIGPSFDATCRAWMSLVPPGGKGTTIRMGLPGIGKPWAVTFEICRHAHAANADVTRRNEKLMMSPSTYDDDYDVPSKHRALGFTMVRPGVVFSIARLEVAVKALELALRKGLQLITRYKTQTQ